MEQYAWVYVLIMIGVSILTNIIVNTIREKRRHRQRTSESRIEENSESFLPPPLPSPLPRVVEPEVLPSSVLENSSGMEGGTPPPMPRRMRPVVRSIYDYPKCYIHKCKNRPGEQQVVFWDTVQHQYRCHKGHYFTGRE